jgi:hypothetical protein
VFFSEVSQAVSSNVGVPLPPRIRGIGGSGGAAEVGAPVRLEGDYECRWSAELGSRTDGGSERPMDSYRVTWGLL